MTELDRNLAENVAYPPHPPRKASAIYRRTHQKLVKDMDEPCWICGVRNSDVQKMPTAERSRWQLETHHAELEWAAAEAFTQNTPESKEMLAKITADFPAIMDDPVRLREWLDSEGQMLVLCATHHRGSLTGVHMVSYPAWKLQRFQVEHGWQFIKQPQR